MTSDLTRLLSLRESGAPLTWVLTGDSITHGLLHTNGRRNYVDHLHELIRGDLDRVQDIVINTAISGWRIVLLLEDFERRVAAWRPDVVTVMIGTNDCSDAGVFPVITPAQFAASVAAFVARVRELGAIPVLLTPPAIDVAGAPERARLTEFAQQIREVADRKEVILVDTYAAFIDTETGRVRPTLLNDPFHPNAAGHAVLAREIAGALSLNPAPDSDRVLPALETVVSDASPCGARV